MAALSRLEAGERVGPDPAMFTQRAPARRFAAIGEIRTPEPIV